MRLVYLDEAGTSHSHPILCVAGVIVHGDVQWPRIDDQITALIREHIPEPDQNGFIFHTTDIFHGSRYFDRRAKPEWTRARRMALLVELSQIIERLNLPVVAGMYEKAKTWEGILSDDIKTKHTLIHDGAAMDCLIWTDRWLARYAPREFAVIVHEDGGSAKRIIKDTVRAIRSVELMNKHGLDLSMRKALGLPLKKIIDTVHFAEKPDAKPLQLADLCAFSITREQVSGDMPSEVMNVIHRHTAWIGRERIPSSVSLAPAHDAGAGDGAGTGGAYS